MKMPEIKLNKHHLFSLFVLFWIGLGILGLFLTMLGIFYKAILLTYLAIFGILFLYLLFANAKAIKFSWYFYAAIVISLATVFIFSYFTTPTIFSGRDQGSLSESAVRLTQNHKLEFSSEAEKEFFGIYGTGKALSFPGFNYVSDGNLKTGFPLGYISWLAIFYSFFGLSGFIAANGLSFLIFILSFYLLAKIFLKSDSALILVLLTITTFVFSWFFKFTLSENLALALLWFFIYEFILFLKNTKRFFFLAALISLGFLAFARIEALAFFLMMIVTLFLKYKNWRNIYAAIGKKVLFFAGGIILIYLTSLFVNKEFYMVLAKAILKPFIETTGSLSGRNFSSIFYASHIFIVYSLFNFLLLGTIGVIYLYKQKKWEMLIPFFITAPAFVYLFLPNISLDSPWMLRRFLFAVIPVCIFYTVYFLDNISRKRIYFYALSLLLFIINLFIFVPYLNFSPNKNLLPQIETLSEKFSNSDLILVDREATGDAWSMLTGPMSFLYEKQAVYFFNPEDLDKIDLTKFSQVYFIIPDKNISFYENSGLYSRLEIKESYVIENNVLDVSNRFNLPEKKDILTEGKIYLLKQYAF